MATLTPKEKITMWHNGTRKLNIGACSVEKIKKYSEFCKELGYSKEYNILQDELSNRMGGTTDLKSLTPEERRELFMSKCGLSDDDSDVYIYPKTRKGWEAIKKAFASHYPMDPSEKKERLEEWVYDEDGTDEFAFLSDSGSLSMELDFDVPEFEELPVEMQVVCCEIEWTK